MASQLFFVASPIHVLLAGWVTCHVLLNKRDVRAAIGWIGTAWLAPLVGALLYLGFGISRVKRRAHRLMGLDRPIERSFSEDISSSDPIGRLKIAIGKITGEEASAGKVVAILDSGDEAYPHMLSAINSAEFCVDLSTYIFRTDEVGLEFIGALARAHRRGVKVRALIDGFGGGFLLSPAYRRLRKEGVPVARFLHSMLPWKMPLLDLRLHKKTLIIDRTAAYVGGLNIGVENLTTKRQKTVVRDLHFRVEGPVVDQIEEDFAEDWTFTTGEPPMIAASRRSLLGDRQAARAIAAGPDRDGDQLILVLLSAINSAQTSIRIATPYFLPDEQLITALQLASLRGVDVQIALPAINDHRVVAWATRPHIEPLLQTSCRIWCGLPPFDHTKLMTIDGEWSLIGSSNWDVRSLRLNFEIALECHGADLADRLSKIFDQKRIAPVTLKEIEGRPFVIKLRDAAARLLTPYL
jgi:cardiolipin synthase A/B